MRSLSWALILGLTACYPAAAQMTLSELKGLCDSSEATDKSACGFYIWGVIEGASLMAGAEKDSSGKYTESTHKPFCLPAGAKKSNMETLVTGLMAKDLLKFPQDRTMPAVSFVAGVVAQRFPCAAQ